MTEMRRQQLELREQMMELVPGDQSNARARIQDRIGRDEARYRARKDVVDAMWDAKQGAAKAREMETTAAGQAKLDELMGEVGYTSLAQTQAQTAQAARAAEQEAAGKAALDQLKQEVGYAGGEAPPAEGGQSSGS
jgi:hypothetical protein